MCTRLSLSAFPITFDGGGEIDGARYYTIGMANSVVRCDSCNFQYSRSSFVLFNFVYTSRWLGFTLMQETNGGLFVVILRRIVFKPIGLEPKECNVIISTFFCDSSRCFGNFQIFWLIPVTCEWLFDGNITDWLEFDFQSSIELYEGLICHFKARKRQGVEVAFYWELNFRKYLENI